MSRNTYYNEFLDFEPDAIDELFMEDGVRECLIDMDRLRDKDDLKAVNNRLKLVSALCFTQSLIIIWMLTL